MLETRKWKDTIPALTELSCKWEEKKDQEMPHFNTIEEFRAYYHCIPFEEAVKKLEKLIDDHQP